MTASEVMSASDYINKAISKNDNIFIPDRRGDWKLSTGIVTLDKILGGGIPGGTISQIYGLEGSGKSSLTMSICAEAIKAGKSTIYVALEGYDDRFAKSCGVDIDSPNWNIASGDFAEIVFNIVTGAVLWSDADVIVIDSILATTPKANLEKKLPTELLDKGAQIGLTAKTISEFISKVEVPIKRKKAILIIVNQYRTKIGFISSLQPGGGFALQYASDLKLKLMGKKNKELENVTSTITIDKGKLWDVVPFGTTIIDFNHGTGADKIKDLVNACVEVDVLKKRGAWIYYGEDKWQGVDKFTVHVVANPEIFNELWDKYMKADDTYVPVEAAMALEEEIIEEAKAQLEDNE